MIIADPENRPWADYEIELARMRKLFDLNQRVNSQETLSDAARVVVEGLRDFGFDRAGVFVWDTSIQRLRSLWGTDRQGRIHKEDLLLTRDDIPPTDGYNVVMAPIQWRSELGPDHEGIRLRKGRDESTFQALWGYAPPLPGYYARTRDGDDIALPVTSAGQVIGLIAVDNYVTHRSIDETSAHPFSLVGTELANASLHEQSRYQALLLANVSDAVISVDLDFRVVSWNAAAERIIGRKATDMIGRGIFRPCQIVGILS